MQPRKRRPAGCDDATATAVASDERSRRGSALHRGGHTTPALLDYGGIVVGQLRVPTRATERPPYMKIIFPSAEVWSIFIQASVQVWHCEKVRETRTFVHCPPPKISTSEVTCDWTIFAPRHVAGWRILARLQEPLILCRRNLEEPQGTTTRLWISTRVTIGREAFFSLTKPSFRREQITQFYPLSNFEWTLF